MNKNLVFSKAGLIGLVVIVLIVTGVINLVFKSLRIDLTEDNLYTISDGTRNILNTLEKPITLRFFYSDKQTEDMPQLRNYAKRVRELLDEYTLKAGGNIKLEVIDPEPFSEEQDKAAEYGLQAARLRVGSPEIYFGLVAQTEGDKKEVISFFQNEREEFLEYDLSQLIYKLGRSGSAKVGVISSLSAQGSINPVTREPTAGMVAVTQLEEQFEVTYLDAGADKIDQDIAILLLIHPKELSEQTQYAIDQFALKGGNLLVFVDPNSDKERYQNHRVSDTASNLDKLFEAWGFEMEKEKVIADSGYAHTLNPGNNMRPVRHLGVLGIRKETLSQEDVITKNLESINLATAGSLKPKEGATTQFVPLVQSSHQAMLMDSERFKFLFDPSVLFNDFKASGESYTIAARVFGPAKTAFPDGFKAPDPVEESSGAEKTENVNEKHEHLSKSTQDINVLVFADTDILTNELWVRVQNFFGRQMASPFADNGAFLVNAVDNMQGNADLISIRTRGRFSRPFVKVDALKREAEADFRVKEEALQDRLQKTEVKLGELQQQKEGEEILNLSPEQQQEVENFQREKLKIRKELREVQHQLNKDIENLGTQLKLINIALVPFLLTILALFVRLYRKRGVAVA